MFDSKKFNYLILSIVIFSLPILEFLNYNFLEIGIIIGKSFFILIFSILIFLIITTFLLSFFLKKADFINCFLISSLGFWLLFKHSSINQFFLKIWKNSSLIEAYSSEISLIIIFIIFIIFLIFFFKKNIFLKKFNFIFFYLIFFFIIF